MKKKLLLFSVLIFATVTCAFSQVIIAGSGSPGLIISNPAVNLSVSTLYSPVSGLVDLTCDGIADMRVELIKGPTAIDAPNMASLHVLNPAFEICADTGYTGMSPVHFFNSGDSLICPDTTSWANDTLYKLGDYGCMECPGPFSVSNVFIAYRNTLTSQTGWIKISFYLIDSGGSSPITLSIPEVLSPCTATACTIPTGGSGSGTCGVFSYNYSITLPTCAGTCDGAISITGLSGGTPPYNYNWSPGIPIGDGTPTISGLCTGIYNITFTDGAGNSCTASFNLPNPPGMTYSLVVVSNVSCNGLCDGSICCTGPIGGTAPYSYVWDDVPATTTSCMNGACAGTYALCVTDANGCGVCTSAIVTEPAPVTITPIITNASCSSCCDGSASVTASGGTAGYTYLWSPGGFTFNTFSGLCAGTYTCCVTDANGCTACNSETISFSTGINEINDQDAITVYPNPFTYNTTFEIQSAGTETYSFELTDVLGKKVRSMESITAKQFQISRNELDNGVYFYKISSLKSIIGIGKLVIQ